MRRGRRRVRPAAADPLAGRARRRRPGTAVGHDGPMRLTTDIKDLAGIPAFRTLLGVRLISQTGDGMVQAGLATVFFFAPQNMTTAPGVASALVVMLLPFSVVGPFTGPFIDRWRRRQTLLAGNLLRAGLIVATALVMEAAGVDFEALRQVDFYAAHEALLLEYEDAMIREDSRSGRLYDTSAHMLWVGERTREADGAHVAILAGVHNPVGVKVGPTTSPDDIARLMDRLNPEGLPGRLSLITRMGADRIREALPPLVEAVRADGRPVTWIADPMHGNTITSDNGYKTRRFETILDEIRGFFEVHRTLGTAPGGIHVELTGDDVTEVLGGGEHIDEAGLAEHYETLVDPRLNHQQSLEVAFEIAEMLKG